MNGDWWHGKCGSSEGDFPHNYVQLRASVSSSTGDSDAVTNARMYKVVHDFNSRDEAELSMKKGESVRVKSCGLEDWFMATSESGISGLVPATHLLNVE